MPVIRDIPLSLKTREALRRAGFRRPSEIKPEIKSLVLELLASVKGAVPRKSTPMSWVQGHKLQHGHRLMSVSAIASRKPVLIEYRYR